MKEHLLSISPTLNSKTTPKQKKITITPYHIFYVLFTLIVPLVSIKNRITFDQIIRVYDSATRLSWPVSRVPTWLTLYEYRELLSKLMKVLLRPIYSTVVYFIHTGQVPDCVCKSMSEGTTAICCHFAATP